MASAVTTFKIEPQYATYITKLPRDLRKVKRNFWLKWKKTGDLEIYKKIWMVTNKLRR